MKITITVYGFVKVIGGTELKTENWYFATQGERDTTAQIILAHEEETMLYNFEYEVEVEV